jgi:glyoxylate/hydroxypyruvate reductase A
LLKAIDENIICGASLDVFREEPLPSSHPFWEYSQIQITPHIASITDPKSVENQLLDNYARMKNGKALLNEVDIAKGY